MLQRILALACLGKWPKLRKIDMRFGKWNVRSLHKGGSLMTGTKEIWNHTLVLVVVQEAMCGYKFSYEKGNENQ
jgi:hypothetical protein